MEFCTEEKVDSQANAPASTPAKEERRHRSHALHARSDRGAQPRSQPAAAEGT